ncbi:MAG: hypothetical protein RL291_498, partial [Pseudomonadota bacterium]
PLVEVIAGAASRKDEIDKGCAFVAAIDKLPLVVKSCPGFLVNRVLGPYMLGALKKLEAGTPKEKLDEAARVFGMPMGPIELADTVGLDVIAHVGKILGSSADGTELDRLVKAGNLGKKSGKGFYEWREGKAQKAEGVAYETMELQKLGRELVEPLMQEAERARDDGIVANADLVDAGVIFGTGFAPFRGGPLNFRAAEAMKASKALPQAAMPTAAE